MAERAPATKEDVTPSNDTEEKAPPAPQSSATMPPAVNNDDSLRPGTASSSKSASGGIEVVARFDGSGARFGNGTWIKQTN